MVPGTRAGVSEGRTEISGWNRASRENACSARGRGCRENACSARDSRTGATMPQFFHPFVLGFFPKYNIFFQIYSCP